MRYKLNALKNVANQDDLYAAPVTIPEITKAIMLVGENWKAFGPKTKEWISRQFTNIIDTGDLPPTFKDSRIIAIAKPERYRPIKLLSVI